MGTKKAEAYRYEDDLQMEAAALLRHVLPDDAVFWHTPNGARYDPRAAKLMHAILMKMGMLPGIPDVLILYGGRLFGADAKAKGGVENDAQKKVKPMLRAAGALIAEPFRSLVELDEILEGWGIPVKFSYRKIRGATVMKPSEAAALTDIINASGLAKQRRAARLRRKASGSAGKIFNAQKK